MACFIGEMRKRKSASEILKRLGFGLAAFLVLYLIAWGVFVGLYRSGRLALPAPDAVLAFFMPLYLLSDWTPLQGALEWYAGWWVWVFRI